MRATEQVLPDVTGRVSSDDPFHATISITYDDGVAEITVTMNLGSVLLPLNNWLGGRQSAQMQPSESW